MSAVWAAGTLRLVTDAIACRLSSIPARLTGLRRLGGRWGWNNELVSFTAQLIAAPADDGDLVDVEPVTVIGQRMGELVDVPELVERTEAEDSHIQLATDLAAKLAADRDRYLEALSPQASRELVERLAAS